MRLYLVRHAVTAETGKTLSGRLPGISLSEAGVAMAEALRERLAPLQPDAVISSPVLRCRQTARIITRSWDVEPIVNRAFTEGDYGTWSGRSLRSLYRLQAWSHLIASASRFRFPEGEAFMEIQQRAVVGVESLAAGSDEKTLLVVTHADVIRAILVHYLGMPLDLIHRLDVRPASVSAIDLPAAGTPMVPFVNDLGARTWR